MTAVALVALAMTFPWPWARKTSPPEAHAPPCPSALGDGVLVWESNRSGRWRIWRAELSGVNPRQATPDEPGRDHFCPHISPDGTRMLYLSYPAGETGYDGAKTGRLTLLDLATGATRVLVERARSYHEDRAALWFDPDRFCYVTGDGTTEALRVSTGAREPLLDERHPYHGWLVNAEGAYATSGRPEFYPVDTAARKLVRGNEHGGCQPYFSRDGTWGFWIAGGGGPINRIHLETRVIGTILERADPHLPQDAEHLYFPMLSPCGNLLVFGASRGKHDHFDADYDIYAAPLDPDTLEIAGAIVRCTLDPAVDRFPDAWLAPLPLGRHRGEAPLTVEARAPDDSPDWRWDPGDGSPPVVGPGLRHRYLNPGRHALCARRGATTLRGEALVRATAAPRVERAHFTTARELLVVFDEPVDVARATFTLASGTPIESVCPGAKRRSVALRLARSPAPPDTLVIDGIADLAQEPNRLARTEEIVGERDWPVFSNGLRFHWRNGRPDTAGAASHEVRPSGLARLDRNGSMILGHGMFAAGEGAAAAVLDAVRRTRAFALEISLRPAAAPLAAPGRIVSLAPPGGGRPNFALVEEAGFLVWHVSTSTRTRRSESGARLCALRRDTWQHVIVCYSAGNLSFYLDGERIWIRHWFEGHMDNWQPGRLTFGAGPDGSAFWAGLLEGVAIYDRALSAREALDLHLAQRNMRRAQPPVETIELVGRLARRAEFPALRQIAPYRDALVTFDYDVVRVTRGPAPAGGRVRVVHRAFLDGAALDVRDLKIGAERALQLEPFEANPQVASLFVAEMDDFTWTGPTWFDVGPVTHAAPDDKIRQRD